MNAKGVERQKFSSEFEEARALEDKIREVEVDITSKLEEYAKVRRGTCFGSRPPFQELQPFFFITTTTTTTLLMLFVCFSTEYFEKDF